MAEDPFVAGEMERRDPRPGVKLCPAATSVDLRR
jgi:hypothetical protein